MGLFFRRNFEAKNSKLGRHRYVIELVESSWRCLPNLPTKNYHATFYNCVVCADNLEEAVERSKDKWVEENRRLREEGAKLHYSILPKSSYEMSRGRMEHAEIIIPKVDKSKMSLEEYRTLDWPDNLKSKVV